MPVFDYTADIHKDAVLAFDAVSAIIPFQDWTFFYPYVQAIEKEKETFDGLIVAHFYVGVEITHTVADFVGDYDEILAFIQASPKEKVLFCGSIYMAQSIALACPDKKIYVADNDALSNIGNTLSTQDIENLKKRYEGYPVIMDVNMPLHLKKMADICVSDMGLSRAVEAFPKEQGLLVLPDQNIALSTATRLERTVVTWDTAYSVRDRYTLDHILWCRSNCPEAVVLVHHGCNMAVVRAADGAGSTRALLDYVASLAEGKQVYIFDENSVVERAMLDFPDKVLPLPVPYQCHQMKRITLPKILMALQTVDDKTVNLSCFDQEEQG